MGRGWGVFQNQVASGWEQRSDGQAPPDRCGRGRRLVRSRVGWARVLAFSCLLALVPGCWFEPVSCTDEQRFPLTGDVFDSDGSAIVPDRVTVSYSGNTARECDIEPPEQGASRFRCAEGQGTGLLTAYYGDERASKRFKVREDEDGCHALEQEVDLKFE